jgi:protein-tyrosine-phosphatase
MHKGMPISKPNTTLNGQITSLRLFARVGCLLAIAFAADAQTPKSHPNPAASTIVFVCEHGAAKSVIAAAHFNRLASEKGLSYRAIARGTNPDDAIALAVQSALAREGLDVSSWRPTKVSDDDIRIADRVISFAPGLRTEKPSVQSKLIEWNDTPSVSQNYAAAQATIFRQVQDLVEKLAATPKK